ncbi:Flp pilus assembly protein TadD, contains TPR repeats [Palleronia salina]|uniref:Flp pilus assembly protein TadD, contains TPR repeats n=1 Tax=Palleronia salina TaxID=313368 RepID=A0A1M6EWY3_9RHOB|nr:tetratricopeptide repeat protein [Palleronia salina]SHI89913.1 Flp pilus assembly protein TadD, contains TPR repeats [Palleronia salina]
MRHPIILSLCICGALAGCGARSDKAEVERALKEVNVIDESNLSDIMLTVADPNEAVAYFRKSAGANPDRIDLQRGLASSLIRAKKPDQAAAVWARVAEMKGATHEDRLSLADALIRAGDWDAAEAQLNQLPPTVETFRRYRLEAMIADGHKQWDKADSFYQTAVNLTSKPAGVLNNWGYSKLTRGSYGEAEKLFSEALSHDGSLFTAKNNLTLARGAQRKYELPVVQMTQTEKAQLLHTLGLAAVKQGDVSIGAGLLREAVDTHPQHFDVAARALAALDSNVAN